MKAFIINLLLALTFLVGVNRVVAQGTTAFTYQGQLHDSSTNANGNYTMVFALYDSISGGNQIGSTLTTGPTIANGLFTVNLDFGAGAFTGAARWLDITIASQELSPRVQVLPTPYAQFAAVAATVTNGAIMNAQLASNAVNTTNIQNGAITITQIAAGAVTNANLTINAVATVNIQNAAVTDAKIVSVSGSKVTGGVAFATNATFAAIASTAGSATSAASLTNGIWSIMLSQDNANQLNFNFAPNTPAMLELTTSSVKLNGTLNLQSNPINFDGGTTMFGSGQGYATISGGLVVNYANINGPLAVSSSIIAQGNVSALSFNTTSDRNLKEKFTPINNQEILERVASLPISSWNFKTDGQNRHIGPMAQDFYAAFNVGTDDKHIATVDEDGVALAAIQGLNEKIKEKDAEFQKLKSQNESLEKRLADLEQLVKTSAQK